MSKTQAAADPNPPDANWIAENQIDTYSLLHSLVFRNHGNTRSWWDGYVVNKVSQAAAQVLELGCGTGTTSITVARAGFDVRGTDISPRMIELARQRSSKELDAVRNRMEWAVADMCEVDPKASGCHVVTSAFGHLLNEEHQISCLTSLSDARTALLYIPELLKPESLQLPKRGISRNRVNGIDVSCESKSLTDWAQRIHHANYVFTILASNAPDRRFAFSYSFCFPNRDQMVELAERAGWQVKLIEENPELRIDPVKQLVIREVAYELHEL
uniref:2-polyprenyl-3-methyl-5-hydroxy-6-metoxy-1,4-benzoquinol methylase n=1 Tax=Candidatus Kentrum sp. UNK TaxID=2126344 RepID=A0A451AYQ5_9GAMM|nr:MAG: 2-polyprenyl-3-methyl-5-hydroxy-6-metoxy-1,4-benzoquinol methylase [Candidatus Kentron sp. UNK]VFK71163.1 MAG: 2-polyprenyl-3-methyl-5-hydroxy-6-metoxy-1,4-benzoquinol methylase [Candidatus Kentron sp. UNK]